MIGIPVHTTNNIYEYGVYISLMYRWTIQTMAYLKAILQKSKRVEDANSPASSYMLQSVENLQFVKRV